MEEEGTGCLCCRARQCLIVWSSLSAGLSIINLIIILASGDLSYGNNVVTLIACIINIVVSIFALTAAVTKRRSMLKITFWVVILNLTCFVILMIVSVLIVSDVIGSVEFDDEGGAIAVVIIFYLLAIGVQALLAWTVKRTINEVNLEKNAVHRANHY